MNTDYKQEKKCFHFVAVVSEVFEEVLKHPSHSSKTVLKAFDGAVS